MEENSYARSFHIPLRGNNTNIIISKLLTKLSFINKPDLTDPALLFYQIPVYKMMPVLTSSVVRWSSAMEFVWGHECRRHTRTINVILARNIQSLLISSTFSSQVPFSALLHVFCGNLRPCGTNIHTSRHAPSSLCVFVCAVCCLLLIETSWMAVSSHLWCFPVFGGILGAFWATIQNFTVHIISHYNYR